MRNIRYVTIALLALVSLVAHAEMSATDRRLFVATTGIDFDPGKADSALLAGANVNARNEAMHDATLLILAVKSFARPEAVQWLMAHGANPSLTDDTGKSALDWANQFGIGSRPDGRRVLAALRGGAATEGTASVAPRAPEAAPRPAPVSAQVAAPATERQRNAGAAVDGAIVPGVYECMNQQAMITMMAFGIIDGSSFMNSSGRRGRYAYDAGSATLTLEPGPGQARYKRVGPTLFRPIREDGQLGGFTCPLNRAKNQIKPPW